METVERISARIPKPVKLAFHRAVVANETDMTAVLVAMMTDYAVKHGEKVSDD